MRRIDIVVFLLLLSGCVTFGQMEEGLSTLMGQDARTAFNVLGYPSGKQEFDRDTVYIWSVSTSGTMIIPQTSTTYGTVGTTPVYGTTTYNQIVPVNYNCLIKLIANPGGTLTKWEYNGNISGCSNYIKRLNSYRNSKNK